MKIHWLNIMVGFLWSFAFGILIGGAIIAKFGGFDPYLTGLFLGIITGLTWTIPLRGENE